MKNKVKSKALENIIKHTFCESKNKDSIIDCAYENRSWCPKTCKYAINKYKYWTR